MTAEPALKRAWLAAAAAIILVGPPSAVPAAAAAAKLQSPPIEQSGGSLVECAVANVSNASATVTIRVVNNDVTIATVGPLTVAAGASQGASAFCAGACVRPRCTFVTSTPASGFRASACVAEHTSTNTDKICLPAQ